MERCLREIAAAKAELLAGNPDVAGLCLALADWWTELRILQESAREGAPSYSSAIAAIGGGERPCSQKE